MDGKITCVWLRAEGVSKIYHSHPAHLYLLHFRTVKIDVYDWDRDGR